MRRLILACIVVLVLVLLASSAAYGFNTHHHKQSLHCLSRYPAASCPAWKHGR